ncbi:MAG: hypothetical protein SH850_07055 [Planctomycetaceae bacterium]|nr:hypothetical protein [Planctomycetaceae bacterium]
MRSLHFVVAFGVAGLLGHGGFAVAADVPVVTIRSAGFFPLREDAAYLAELSGQEAVAPGLRLVELNSGNLHGLAEHDQSRPMAIVGLLPDQLQPLPIVAKKWVVVLPIKNFQPKERLEIELSTQKGLAVAPQAKKIEEGLYRWQRPGKPDTFVRFMDDVALLGEDRSLVDTLRPVAAELCVAGSCPTDLEVRWDHRQVPKAWRDFATGVADGMQKSIPRGTEANNRYVKLVLDTARCLVSDCETLVLTLDLSRDDKRVEAQFRLTAKDGTTLADSMSFFSRSPNRYSGLTKPDALLNLLVSVRPSSDMKALLKDMSPQFEIDEFKRLRKQPGVSPEIRSADEQYTQAKDDAIQSWITAGRIEAGVSIATQDGKSLYRLGLYLPGSAELAPLVSDLIRQGSALNSGLNADVGLVGRFAAHQIGTGGVFCFRSEDVLHASGSAADSLVSSLVVADVEPPQNGESPAVFIEGELGAVVMNLSSLIRMPSVRLDSNATGGRIRFQVHRVNREVSANLTLDEAALQRLLKGFGSVP